MAPGQPSFRSQPRSQSHRHRPPRGPFRYGGWRSNDSNVRGGTGGNPQCATPVPI